MRRDPEPSDSHPMGPFDEQAPPEPRSSATFELPGMDPSGMALLEHYEQQEVKRAARDSLYGLDLNVLILGGTILLEPRKMVTDDGNLWCFFTMETKSYTSTGKPMKNATTRVIVKAWKKTAAKILARGRKGDRILIFGALRKDAWANKMQVKSNTSLKMRGTNCVHAQRAFVMNRAGKFKDKGITVPQAEYHHLKLMKLAMDPNDEWFPPPHLRDIRLEDLIAANEV